MNWIELSSRFLYVHQLLKGGPQSAQIFIDYVKGDSRHEKKIKEAIEGLVSLQALIKQEGKQVAQEYWLGGDPKIFHNYFMYQEDKPVGWMDNARVGIGSVVDIMGTNLFVKTKSLKKMDDRLVLGEQETKIIVYNTKFLPDLSKGDVVALHWGFAPLKLNNKQVEILQRTDKQALEMVNR